MHQDIAHLWRRFAQPDKRFRMMPLFRVNDEVRPKQIAWQVESLRRQGCGGLFAYCECMHKGAPFRFLSAEWWRAVQALSRSCAKAGLQFWVYDEQDWPSGTAGNRVIEKHPGTRWKYLCRKEQSVTGPKRIRIKVGAERLIAVAAFQLADGRILTDSVRKITRRCRKGTLIWNAPSGQWIIAIYTWQYGKGSFQVGEYADLLDRNTSQAFIRLSYAAHARKVRAARGAPLQGFFTDEPIGAMPVIFPGPWHPSLPWTDRLEQSFRRLHGYDLRSHLPFLHHDDERKALSVRCHFWDTCAHLFSESYIGALSRFCETSGVVCSGHFNGEESFVAHLGSEGGNLLRQYRYLHVPGIDWIHPCDRHLPATTPKYATSVAHFLGRERTLCESFAAAGWGCSFQDYQRMVNWEHVNGINFQVPITYKYSLRGPNRATFYGPGISYQQPYWEHFRAFADYEARLCALASGRGHVAQAALYYPAPDIASHCWEHGLLNARSREFNHLGDRIRSEGYDFDLVDDAFLTEARLKGGRFILGDESFAIVLLPRIDTIPRRTLRKLYRFVLRGGCVLALGQIPQHSPEWGRLDPKIKSLNISLFGNDIERLSPPNIFRRVGDGHVGLAKMPKDILEMLRMRADPDAFVSGARNSDIAGYHRRLRDGELYLLYNMRNSIRRATVTLGSRGYPEMWDPISGRSEGIAEFSFNRKSTRINLSLRPHQMIPVVLRRNRTAAAPVRKLRILQKRAIPGPFEFAIEETLRRPEIAWNVTGYKRWTSRAKSFSPQKRMPLGDWRRHGLRYFSGLGRYSMDVKLDMTIKDKRVFLDLGKVAVSAEVKCNGATAGVVCLEPYEVDITTHVRPGANRIEVIVANTLSNHFAQFEHLDHKPLHEGGDFDERRVSGLLGPVTLRVATVQTAGRNGRRTENIRAGALGRNGEAGAG